VQSGRAGIVLALKGLGLRQGALVAVPLYCCPVVLRAITSAGCRARFIDVDANTYCMSANDLAAKSADVDAVIAVHMFGNMCDVPALREAVPGTPIIEDCAQGLGSSLHGRVAGTFGDIAVFSFRSGKYISAGEGGAVYCRNGELERRVSELISELPVCGRLSEVVHAVKTSLRSMLRAKPLWGLIGSPLWNAYSENVDHMSQAPIVMGQIFAGDRETAIRRLPALPTMIERQRRNADHYLRSLTVDADMLCKETPTAFFNRLQFPLLLQTPAQCHQLAERLRRNHISTTRPYKDIAGIAVAHYGYTSDCPESERIALRVLVIPCNYGLRKDDVERITESVNRAWRELGDRGKSIDMPLSTTAVAQTRET